MSAPIYMVFDVESIGLHGEGYAVAWVLVDARGTEFGYRRLCCPPDRARGTKGGHEWVLDNCPALPITQNTPREVREIFWQAWKEVKRDGGVLVADCAWPVEANFLASCVEDDPIERCWEGPYPLHEIATARALDGLEATGTASRLPSELPEHDPLADARQSARLWLEALHRAPNPPPASASLP